jgi:hypothetical protein
MAYYTRNTGKTWTRKQVSQLRTLARENTPTRVIGLKLGRSEGSVRTKAQSSGISLKPSNQSPYSRKKSA